MLSSAAQKFADHAPIWRGLRRRIAGRCLRLILGAANIAPQNESVYRLGEYLRDGERVARFIGVGELLIAA